VWLKPKGFKESNNMAISQGYFDLPTLKDSKCFTSCWSVPLLKRIKLLFTGRIWLCLEHRKQPKEMKDIFDGLNYHQPTSMTLDYPFNRKDRNGKKENT